MTAANPPATPSATPPTPPAGEIIDIWIVSPAAMDEEQLAESHRLMTSEERTRHAKFVFERHRREYATTRGLLRAVLSRYRPIERAAWGFQRNEYGRPSIEPPCGLRFNLTNHPALVACAVREGELELGCDLEPLDRGAEVLAIAETVFADRELAELRALPAAAQPDRAIALWTLKEAYIKARSMGMSLPLKGFAFSFPDAGAQGAQGAPPRISFTDEIDDAPARWTFATIDVEGHRIALAVELATGQANGSAAAAPAAALRARVWRLGGFAAQAPAARVAELAIATTG